MWVSSTSREGLVNIPCESREVIRATPAHEDESAFFQGVWNRSFDAGGKIDPRRFIEAPLAVGILSLVESGGIHDAVGILAAATDIHEFSL